jgi:hypothetical protein
MNENVLPERRSFNATWYRDLCRVLVLLMLAWSAHAQLGNGWVTYSPTKKIHLDDEAGLQTFTWTSYKSVCADPICADYRYDDATKTETFQIFDSRSNRSEIRLQNEYSTGSRQFEGWVTIYAPLEDESLFQIFGSVEGATQMMIRGFSADGGSIATGSKTLVSNCYGKEVRMNVIHLQEDVGAKIIIYINGEKVHEVVDDEPVTNYQKYGCYGTTNGNVPAIVKWRNVRVFQNGTAPSGTPAAPSSLTATAVSTSQINLSWSDNSSLETNHQVERSTNGGTSWSALVTLGANVESYSNTGLTTGTTYHYRVRATNANGNSGFSNIANATTHSVPVQPTYQAESATISAGIVESNHAGFNGTGFVNYDNVVGSYVEWKINVASAGSYNLAIRNSNGGTVDRPMNIIVNGTTTHNNQSFNPTGAWSTWVSTTFTANLNAGINTIRATATTINGGPNVDQFEVNGLNALPAAPSGLAANASGMNQINLNWTDNSSNETQFRIERSLNAGSTWSFLTNVGAGVTSYANTGLTHSTTYHYRVRAENAAGNSAFSNIANAKTESPVITNVALSKPVTASGSDTNVPANAVDGNTATRWSASPMPQWLEVDLGSVHTISRSEVVCYLDRAYRFVIEVKTSATGAYTTIVDQSTNTTPGTITAPIANTFNAQARYVRITVTGASGYTGTWASLLEFRVFGFADPGGSSAAARSSSSGTTTQLSKTSSDPEISSEKVLLESFPNPAVSSVTIRYIVKNEGSVGLYLYNAALHKTTVLIQDHKLPGIYETQADISGLPCGIHVFRMVTDGKSHVLKFLKK